MDHVVIKNVSDYIKHVNDFQPKEKSLFKIIKLFRGYADYKYTDIPSIFREIKGYIDDTLLFQEMNMINTARAKMPELFINDNDVSIRIITKLQHYGLPTRILDFTTNSLVALYFACLNQRGKEAESDGKVICVCRRAVDIYTSFSTTINFIADMYHLGGYSQFLDQFIKYIEHKSYWKFFRKERITNDEVVKEIGKPIFFVPEWNTERIKRQQGIFLIFPNEIVKSDDENADYILTEKLVSWQPEEHFEMRIPKDEKSGILKELENHGITKSFLFPDPENICADIFNDLISQDLFPIMI